MFLVKPLHKITNQRAQRKAKYSEKWQRWNLSNGIQNHIDPNTFQTEEAEPHVSSSGEGRKSGETLDLKIYHGTNLQTIHNIDFETFEFF